MSNLPARFIYTPERLQRARENASQFSWAEKLIASHQKAAEEATRQPEEDIRQWFLETTPNNQTDCPSCGEYWLNYVWDWKPEHPNRLTCNYCGYILEEDTLPANDTIQRTDPQGKMIPHPVHRDEKGKAYPIWQTIGFMKASHGYDWIESLGLAYALDPREDYARAAKQLLYHLAEVYPGYILHDNFRFDSIPWGWAGKLTGWHMSDANILIRLGTSWDAIRHHDSITDEERHYIEENLFRKAGEMLTAVRPLQGISNDVLYRFGGVALIGRLLRDHDFISWVMEGDESYPVVLDHLFFKDGAWHERSLSYHGMMTRSAWLAPFYLEGYSDPETYFGSHPYRNISLKNLPKLEALNEIPFLMRYPDGTLPAVNDGRWGTTPPALGPESMYILTGKEKWLAYTDVAYEGKLAEEGDLFSLLNRPSVILERLGKVSFDASVPSRSADYTGMALFMLRRGQGENQTVFTMHHHKFANSHSHYDALSTTLWAQGREMLCDIGYALFGIRERTTWYMASLSHNTLTVDTFNQRAPNGVANFIYHGEHFSTCEGESWDSYRFICEPFARQIALVDLPDGKPYALDIFRGGGGEIHDYALHADTDNLDVQGVNLQAADGMSGKDYAYSAITEVQTGNPETPWKAVWSWEDGARLSASFPDNSSDQMFTGKVPGMRVKEQQNRKIDSLFLRRSGKDLRSQFVAAFDPHRKESAIQKVEILEASPLDHWALVVRVTLDSGLQDFLFSAYIDVAPMGEVFQFEELSIAWKSRFGLVRVQDGKILFEEWMQAPMEGLNHDI